MGLLNNVKTFSNWYCIYLTRYGLLRRSFVFKTKRHERFLVRPWTDDVRIVKSVFAKNNYENEFISVAPGSVVVDVGANIGAFTVLAARRAKKVIAYEPEPENFELLCINIELNNLGNVVPLRKAIAREKGARPFHTAEGKDSSSHSFYLQQSGNTFVVETLSVADVIEQESLTKVDFLKLDCEGAEFEILDNLSPDTAQKIEQIALEVHQKDGLSADDLSKRLSTLGFDVRMGKAPGYIYARRKK